MKLLVTGGAGFIGSAVVRQAVREGHGVVNVDALTYAACLDNVSPVSNAPGYVFEHADIRDQGAMTRILAVHKPDAIMHLAAESHVDRSIDGPAAFIETNVTGTYTLLEAARAYWIGRGKPADFRFHHISTDEVYGTLGADRACSPRRRPMRRTRPIPPRRPPPTIWCAPGARPTGCRC